LEFTVKRKLKNKKNMLKLSDLKEGVFLKWDSEERDRETRKIYPFAYGQVKEITESYIRVLRFSDCELAYIHRFENMNIISETEIKAELEKIVHRFSEKIKNVNKSILILHGTIEDIEKDISIIESYL